MSRRARILRRGLAVGGLLLFALPSVRAAESLPDPTRPPASARIAPTAAAPDADAKLELRAIFFADDRRFAVLNGRRVEVGDRVAGAEVVAIDVDRVRLRREGETLELELVAPAFKNARRSGRSSPTLAAPAAPTPSPATATATTRAPTSPTNSVAASPAAPLGGDAEPTSVHPRGALR